MIDDEENRRIKITPVNYIMQVFYMIILTFLSLILLQIVSSVDIMSHFSRFDIDTILQLYRSTFMHNYICKPS